ncbi:MAG: hypothetical protein Fur0022_32530 [Anaerolineales bacterium]
MPSLAYDLALLQGGIPELQAYLLSNEIYWSLSLVTPPGERPYPKMTLGWLLLAQARAGGWVSHAPLSPPAHQFAIFRQQLAVTRTQWLTAWKKKASQEFSARLKLWTQYLNEYRVDKLNAHQYSYEVQRRVLLQLLQPEAEQLAQAELDLLHGLDTFLQAVLKPGAFVWEPELAPAFPPETYWYLYGTLPEK